MRVLGERISILKKEDLISVVILPEKNKRKLGLLFLWLLAWTVCGIVVFTNYSHAQTQQQKTFLIVYLGFWFYFEVSIGRAFIWKRWGKEKIWIQKGSMHYQREVNGKGKIKEWNIGLLSRIELVELRPTRLADTLSQSYWVRGGERLEFAAQGSVQRFGMQLSDSEALQVRAELNKFLP